MDFGLHIRITLEFVGNSLDNIKKLNTIFLKFMEFK